MPAPPLVSCGGICSGKYKIIADPTRFDRFLAMNQHDRLNRYHCRRGKDLHQFPLNQTAIQLKNYFTDHGILGASIIPVLSKIIGNWRGIVVASSRAVMFDLLNAPC